MPALANAERSTLVILSNAEQRCADGAVEIRCGFETQMDDFAGRFARAYLYSPRLNEAFDGYRFESPVACRPLCQGMHRRPTELLSYLPAYVSGLVRAIRRHRHDAVFLVYVPDSYIGVLALLVGRILGARMICRVTNDLVSEFVTRRPSRVRATIGVAARRPLNVALRWLIGRVPTFFTGALFLGPRPSFYPITSCSLRRGDAPATASERAGVRRAYFVGRFDENKGWRDFLEAARLAPRDLEFHVVGFGLPDQVAELERAAREAGPHARLVLHGFVPFGPALFAHLRQADVLVVPSANEYQGKTHIEGMAFGCCVVATAVPGISEYVRHEVNGLLVPPRDGRAILDAILRLREDPALRRRIRAGARRTAQGLTVEAMNDFILERAREHGALAR